MDQCSKYLNLHVFCHYWLCALGYIKRMMMTIIIIVATLMAVVAGCHPNIYRALIMY